MFLIPVSFIILGELPDKSGVVGIFLVVAGAYVLQIHHAKKGLLEPLRSIRREKGSVYMLLVAVIYSITATLGKHAINHSSPTFFALFYFGLLAVILFPIMARRSRSLKPLRSRSGLKLFMIIGITYALMIFCHVLSITMIEVVYMVSVKRISLLIAVIYGGVFYGEEHIGWRLAGGIIMLTGVYFITLL
jgi:drug/metabolite transporter (DMT)-like permease